MKKSFKLSPVGGERYTTYMHVRYLQQIAYTYKRNFWYDVLPGLCTISMGFVNPPRVTVLTVPYQDSDSQDATRHLAGVLHHDDVTPVLWLAAALLAEAVIVSRLATGMIDAHLPCRSEMCCDLAYRVYCHAKARHACNIKWYLRHNGVSRAVTE